MSDISPNDRLITPLYTVLRDALIQAGFPVGVAIPQSPMIERDGVVSGAIYLAPKFPVVTNRSTEGTNSGKTKHAWRDADNKHVSRYLRSRLILNFYVEFSFPKFSQAVDVLMNFIALTPRMARDAHRFTGYSDANTPPALRVPLADQGNTFEITLIEPIFPVVRTNTQKSYSCSIVARFEGGVYLDAIDGLPVTVRFTDPTISD